jgi:hypothetical protein
MKASLWNGSFSPGDQTVHCADCVHWAGRCLKGKVGRVASDPACESFVPGCFTNYAKAEFPNNCKTCDSELKSRCQIIAANKPKEEKYSERSTV